ncbi:CoA-dependent acyltransferase [Tothia fuscella]|uniref:CoA-dependent acyltransferase n=1 Tax=Tothia fuscella TaxID=1048955 RepID=A0A9P4TXV5_9PEZI|nr:CoA-dependent acyltransferase [Tothia fuscella]
MGEDCLLGLLQMDSLRQSLFLSSSFQRAVSIAVLKRHERLWLHSLAQVYVSPETLHRIGSDGGNKRFETKQLSQAFATTRVPGVHLDTLRTYPDSRHAVVWSKGKVFKIDIIDAQNNPVALDKLLWAIEQLLRQTSSDLPCADIVASFSTNMDRSEWATLRETVLELNSSSMYNLESAIVSIAMHDEEPDDENSRFKLAKASQNVYSDKTLGFSVFGRGGLAMRAEHAAVDAGLICYLINIVCEKIATLPTTFAPDRRSHNVEELRFGSLPSPSMKAIASSPVCSQYLSFSIEDDPKRLRFLRSKRLYNFALQLAFQATLWRFCPDTPISVLEPTALRGTGPAIGPGCVVLKRCIECLDDSTKKELILNELNVLLSRHAKFTGSWAPGMVSVESSVYLEDQIVLTYLGHVDETVLCVAGSGRFFGRLDDVEREMRSAFGRIVDIAHCAAPMLGPMSQSMNTRIDILLGLYKVRPESLFAGLGRLWYESTRLVVDLCVALWMRIRR